MEGDQGSMVTLDDGFPFLEAEQWGCSKVSQVEANRLGAGDPEFHARWKGYWCSGSGLRSLEAILSGGLSGTGHEMYCTDPYLHLYHHHHQRCHHWKLGLA